MHSAPLPSHLRPPPLVIFDCDGVLVQSEALVGKVWCAALAADGVVQSLEEQDRLFFGKTLGIRREWLVGQVGDARAEAIIADYLARLKVAFATDLQPTQGIRALLDAVQGARVPVCVATNGTTALLGSKLTAAGVADVFPPAQRFTAEMVAAPKPAPDLCRHAAAAMGQLLRGDGGAFPPASCVVVEDSVDGTTGAKAAGMAVIGYTGAYEGATAQAEAAARLVAAGASVACPTLAEVGQVLGVL